MNKPLYHISPNGIVGECRAEKGQCPFKSKHYDNLALAYIAAEKESRRYYRRHQPILSKLKDLKESFSVGENYSLKTMAVAGVGLAVAGLLGGSLVNAVNTTEVSQPVEIVQAASTPSSYNETAKYTIIMKGRVFSHRVQQKKTGYENTVKLPDGKKVTVHSQNRLKTGTEDIVYHVRSNDGRVYLTASSGGLENVELPGNPSKTEQFNNEMKSAVMRKSTLSSAAIAGAAGIMLTAIMQGTDEYRHARR
jgi:hypothetical protein